MNRKQRRSMAREQKKKGKNIEVWTEQKAKEKWGKYMESESGGDTEDEKGELSEIEEGWIVKGEEEGRGKGERTRAIVVRGVTSSQVVPNRKKETGKVS